MTPFCFVLAVNVPCFSPVDIVPVLSISTISSRLSPFLIRMYRTLSDTHCESQPIVAKKQNWACIPGCTRGLTSCYEHHWPMCARYGSVGNAPTKPMVYSDPRLCSRLLSPYYYSGYSSHSVHKLLAAQDFSCTCHYQPGLCYPLACVLLSSQPARKRTSGYENKLGQCETGKKRRQSQSWTTASTSWIILRSYPHLNDRLSFGLTPSVCPELWWN